jgi:hypothetical protein
MRHRISRSWVSSHTYHEHIVAKLKQASIIDATLMHDPCQTTYKDFTIAYDARTSA